MKGAAVPLTEGQQRSMRERDMKKRRRARLLQVRQKEAERARETRERYKALRRSKAARRVAREREAWTEDNVAAVSELSRRCKAALGAMGAAHEQALEFTDGLRARAEAAHEAWQGSAAQADAREDAANVRERVEVAQRPAHVQRRWAARRRIETERFAVSFRSKAWEHHVAEERAAAEARIRAQLAAPPPSRRPTTRTTKRSRLLTAQGQGLDFTTTRFHSIVASHVHPRDPEAEKENRRITEGEHANGEAGAARLINDRIANGPLQRAAARRAHARERARARAAGGTVGARRTAAATSAALEELAAIEREVRSLRDRRGSSDRVRNLGWGPQGPRSRAERARQKRLEDDFERVFLYREGAHEGGKAAVAVAEGDLNLAGETAPSELELMGALAQMEAEGAA
jgi:hypothetical protein